MPAVSLAPDCDLFVLVGEPSGDAYGGAIVERLRALAPGLTVAAMGGPKLRAAGAEIEQGIDGLAVMGFLPVLRRLPEFIALGRRVSAAVRARRPKVVLTIDYPGFNFRLLRRMADLRAEGTRFVHVVAPQVWAWRPRRAKKYAAAVDRLLCFFPFEPPLFTRHGANADFVGHPLVDLVAETAGRGVGALREEVGLADGARLLLLAPGSREREVRELLPILDATASLVMPALRRRSPGPVQVAVSKARDLPHALYREYTDLPVVDGGYRGLCSLAHAGIIASGTATLEAALLGLPHAIVYRGDPVSARLLKHLIRTDHVGLPNIVHKRRVCPELLQDELEPTRLAARLLRLWDGPAREERAAVLGNTGALLGGGGAMNRIAELLIEELAHGRRRRSTFDQHTVEPAD